MSRKLKVLSGACFVEGIQVKGLVAATSKKRVAEIVGVSLNYISVYWGETGNKHDIEVALGKPETFFYCGINDFGENRQYKEK